MSVRQRKQRVRFGRAGNAPRLRHTKETRRQGQSVSRKAPPPESGPQATPAPGRSRFSVRAGLCALGRWIVHKHYLDAMHEQVKIEQKRTCYTPTEKLVDCLIGLLWGIEAMYEINTTVRTERFASLCFGRKECAEASTIQATLDRCTEDHVRQLRGVLLGQLREHGGCTRHNFEQRRLLLDIDLSGKRAGAKAEGSTKGHFSGRPHGRGRQLVRVLASQYGEIVCQYYVPGNTNSSEALKDAIRQAEEILQLTEEQRARTLIRADAGFGTDENINWLLSRGYGVLTKVYSHRRVDALVRTVARWEETRQPGREIGLPGKPHRYGRRTVQIAIRKWKGEKWKHAVLVSTLCEMDARALLQLYDKRGGHPESSFQQDGKALPLQKRQKKRMAASQMLLGLAQMAHNVLVWAKRETEDERRRAHLGNLGLRRWVRDILSIPGCGKADEDGFHITLLASHPMSRPFIDAFGPSLEGSQTYLSWGQI
jgi:hypothetical protein